MQEYCQICERIMTKITRYYWNGNVYCEKCNLERED